MIDLAERCRVRLETDVAKRMAQERERMDPAAQKEYDEAAAACADDRARYWEMIERELVDELKLVQNLLDVLMLKREELEHMESAGGAKSKSVARTVLGLLDALDLKEQEAGARGELRSLSRAVTGRR